MRLPRRAEPGTDDGQASGYSPRSDSLTLELLGVRLCQCQVRACPPRPAGERQRGSAGAAAAGSTLTALVYPGDCRCSWRLCVCSVGEVWRAAACVAPYVCRDSVCVYGTVPYGLEGRVRCGFQQAHCCALPASCRLAKLPWERLSC